jgi:tetratricopeptide (TPR) repeat protein
MASSEFQSLCLETLTGGAVQSYVDLIYLACDGQTKPSQLPAIRRHLVDAENARRRGDTSAVIGNYSALASLFAASGNMRTAIYFYERSSEIAKLTGDSKAEMESCRQLGEAYEACGDSTRAVSFFEAHRLIASSLGDTSEGAVASQQLVKVYLKQAQDAEAAENLLEALGLYKASVDAALSSDDVAVQAETQYHSGRLHVLLGQPQEAVPYFQSYVSLTASFRHVAILPIHHPYCRAAKTGAPAYNSRKPTMQGVHCASCCPHGSQRMDSCKRMLRAYLLLC